MLEQAYYVGELIGVAVIIGSLLFVAKEIRLNTNQMRVGASNSWVELQLKLAGGLAENREVAALWLKGESDADFETLDEVDRLRLVWFEFRALTAWSNLFALRQQKLLPDPQWTELNWMVGRIGKRRATREAWRTFGAGFDKSFSNFLRPLIEPSGGEAGGVG